MEWLYRKDANGKFVKAMDCNNTMFPADGVWVVTGGRTSSTLVMQISEINGFTNSFKLSKLAQFKHYVAEKIMHGFLSDKNRGISIHDLSHKIAADVINDLENNVDVTGIEVNL